MNMTDEEAINLIRESALKFALANISWGRARYGIMGFWVGLPLNSSESDQLLRARQSKAAWTHEFHEFENPYNSIVCFLETGGRFISWEQKILDVICPSCNKYGLSEASFTKA